MKFIRKTTVFALIILTYAITFHVMGCQQFSESNPDGAALFFMGLGFLITMMVIFAVISTAMAHLLKKYFDVDLFNKNDWDQSKK